MSRILILGGTGFIGRNMVEHFLRLGHEVHATHLNREPYEGPIWHSVDLRTPCYWLMRDMDVVIHAAATTSGSKDITERPYIHTTDNAVMGSNIFRGAFEAKVKHVIFFSCTTMFRDGIVTEESPIDIHPKYFGVAHTKLYLEKMCEFYPRLGETKFTAIRHSNIYGPHDKYDLERSHMFGATVRKVMDAGKLEFKPEMCACEVGQRAEESSRIKVWGTGEEFRDLLYVSDLCDFVQAAIEKQPDKFGLYNCGYGISFKVKDIVQRIIDASGKNLHIEHDLTEPSIPTSLTLDCTKAQRELVWNPKITLPEGIKKTLNWYMEDVR